MTLRYETRAPACDAPPSDLALDRLHLGVLEGDARAAVQAHVDGCPMCRARFEKVSLGFDAFPALDERKVLARARSTRAPRRWWVVGLVAAVGAMVTVFALRTVEMADDPAPGVRTKGAAALRVFRQPAGSAAPAEEVISGSTFSAGDRIRFAVDLPSAGAVAILAREGAGAPYRAWPPAGAAGVLTAGDGQMLPDGSAELDDAPGPEHLFLVHCPAADTLPECAADGDGLNCGEACTVSRFVIEKSTP